MATFSEGFNHGALVDVVCDGHAMRRGRHYATFTLRGGHDSLNIGVAGASFDPNSADSAHESPHCWVLYTSDGELWHDDWSVEWEGRPLERELKKDDVVVLCPSLISPRTPRDSRLCAMQGMLLDCDEATLTVWVNGERKGVMVRPGMTYGQDNPVPRLEGPLRWVAGMYDGASVAIDGPLPPPA